VAATTYAEAGSIAIDASDYERITGDASRTDATAVGKGRRVAAQLAQR